MKKFLLSCFLTLAIVVNAQYNYTGNFEDPGYSTTIYKQFGGGTRSAAALCNGVYGGALALSTTVTSTGYMVDVSQISQAGNGQKIDCTAQYKKASGIVGTISLAYFLYDSASALWSIYLIGSTVSLTTAATTTCSTLTATIPAGSIQPGQVAGIGVWVTRTSGTGSIYADDFTILQENVTTVPACSAFTAPVAGSTVSAGNFAFTWNTVATAANYKLTIGTTSGGSDVLNSVVTGNSANVSLAPNTTFYAKVVPSNLNGDAVGCSEITFNTNSSISYCGPITTTAPTGVYPISSVNLNAVTNTSSATAGSIAPYEDFTSTVFNVTVGNTFPLTVIGTGAGTNRFGMTTFVDWNNDGDFADSGEQFFTSPASSFLGGTGTAITLTGNIIVPAGTTIGNKRMRIKYNFNSSTIALNAPLSDPCGTMGNGQTEDYTVNVQNPLAVSEVSKSKITVSPNPFSGELRISDIKGVKYITVNDMSGRLIKKLAPSTTLNLYELKQGLYIISLHMEDGSIKSMNAIKK